MSKFETVSNLLSQGESNAVAVTAPGKKPLTFNDLRELVNKTVNTLNNFGMGRNDNIAIVLPNGPEMATAFLSIAAGATTAPLNPNFREKEFEFYLGDLDTRLLLVQKGIDSPVRAAAKKLNIPIVELIPDKNNTAGKFDIEGDFKSAKKPTRGYASSEETALVLHTSGTTSKPKIVPLSHANICASAINIARTLSLNHDDHCMNVMPLFHIHGLIAAVLSSLGAKSSIYCTPGFNALKFFTWMEESNPSWYTAVPIMHQAILGRAGRNKDIIEKSRLRFVRSSSASLPPQVMDTLEKTFHVPVIEAYGMTEAAHQMASNPLPPLDRKPGTVGLAAGPDISIMKKNGELLSQGNTGEVVIRGENVTDGYKNNPDANNDSFVNGWFRTGDQGIIDSEGYLRLTGRLKEIINRGGEKISPREVDEVLIDHPAVKQAVTFALPHEKLGEDVAAAVILKENVTATDKEIREFARSKLADFKVPRKVIFLDEIPKGPTGKFQRIGLAEKLGLTS